MATPSFDRDFWEQLWSRTLRERADAVADRPPNAHLTAEVGDLPPGRALDAGCGHGSDTFWLAADGWHVTAVDFFAAALAHAQLMAEAAGTDVAGRVDWVEADLETWTPQPGHYDLVACLYVHVAGTVEEMVRRMGAGVAPGGTLFLVGYRPIDPATGAATPAAGQVQGLGRSGGRRARSPLLGIRRRRGSSPGRGRHRRRRRDTCAAYGLTSLRDHRPPRETRNHPICF